MASLKDTEQLAQHLEDIVGKLRSELSNGNVDFEKLVSIADDLSEQADNLAETFNTVNETLMQRLQQAKSGGGGGGGGRSRRSSESGSEAKAGARS